MDSQPQQLHILFLPFMAHGHMIPTTDMARLFAMHGVKTTIVTTPLNAPLFSTTIERDRNLGVDISIRIIKFPSTEAGLRQGCENLNSITSNEMELKFFKAISLLKQPFEQLLEECRPNCIVADMMFPWATEVAAMFKIPRLLFHGTSFFALCVWHSLREHEPCKGMPSDFQSFIIPGLPDQIKLTRLRLPSYYTEGTEDEHMKHIDQALQSEMTCYGVLVNSFHELEPAYSEHYKNVIGRKAWHIGPVSLCNRSTDDKAQRGDIPSSGEHECLKWLDSKKPNSVLYACFGSMFCYYSAHQLAEIATGLEAAGQYFIWVVQTEEQMYWDYGNKWLPEGFEKRIEGKGLIIKGWAPQLLILDHEAIGGFMTHCGWNSILESVTAGVPMVTWPLFAEQFFNEKLVTDVLKIGVGVGAEEWNKWFEGKIIRVQRDDIKNVVTLLMVGEEAEEMRNRTMALKAMARRANEEGGSSYSDLNALLEKLRLNCT